MENLQLLFTNHTFIIVSIGTSLLGFISGILGSFIVLKKQSLLGDGIAHTTLPGVILSFLITKSKNLEILLLGALISAFLGYMLINFITKNSKVKFDSALAIVLSVFFGFAMVLLTISQKTENANQIGLDTYIYGQASAMLIRDVEILIISVFFLLVVLNIFWKEFKLITFDEEFAKVLGYKTDKLNMILNFLVIISIVIGLQSVGVILISALLICPSVSARQWTNSLEKMVLLSGIFGMVSSLIGTIISSSQLGFPTGACIVIIASLICFFSILFAPNRGIIHKIYNKMSQNKGV
ncbi:MAG: metal ABC transporter permease [Peptostreptococcaceae bacterium]